MKKLTLKEIAITIIVSYLVTSYIQKSFNPFNWGTEVRTLQIVLTVAALSIKYIIKIGDEI